MNGSGTVALRRSAELEELRAEYPAWQITDLGDHYQALLPGQVVKRRSAAHLRAALGPTAEDVRITDARLLLAEQGEAVAMAMAPNEMFRLLGRYRSALSDLVDLIDTRTC